MVSFWHIVCKFLGNFLTYYLHMRSILIAISLILCIGAFAQVGEVKERAREHKESGDSGSSSDSWSSDGDDELDAFFLEAAWFIIRLPFEGLYLAQVHQLHRRYEEPWRISFETDVSGGFDPSGNVSLLTPTIRGNWGLLSTQLRYTRVFDMTGTLSTWDWQVVQFNIVNSRSVRLVGGLGFSHEVEIDQTHFEGLGELSVFAMGGRLVPTAVFRWSGDGYPRKDFSLFADFRPQGHADGPTTSFRLGYQHQNWYGVKFNFIKAGIGIILR